MNLVALNVQESEPEVSWTDESIKSWLSTQPRGAYTTCRTVESTSVLRLSQHISRTLESFSLMHTSNVSLPSLEEFSLIVKKLLSKSVEIFLEEKSDTERDVELRITILMVPQDNDNGYSLKSFVEKLSERPIKPVIVQLSGYPRSNPLAKDSAWVTERKEIENNKVEGVNEVILENNQCLYEGLTSNFFIVLKGKSKPVIVTAGKEVLEGTIRNLILEATSNVCEIEIRLPTVSELKSTECIGAFISSTSRLLLPISTVIIIKEDRTQDKVFEDFTLVKQLENIVLSSVKAHSESLFK